MPFLRRFPRAWINLGPYHALLLFAMLAYIVYLAVQMALDGFQVGVFLVAAGLLIPRLIAGQMVAEPHRTQRALNVCWYAIVAFLVLEFAGVVSYNIIVGLTILFLAALFIGARFWFLSDPRLFTDRGFDRVLGAYLPDPDDPIDDDPDLDPNAAPPRAPA